MAIYGAIDFQNSFDLGLKVLVSFKLNDNPKLYNLNLELEKEGQTFTYKSNF